MKFPCIVSFDHLKSFPKIVGLGDCLIQKPISTASQRARPAWLNHVTMVGKNQDMTKQGLGFHFRLVPESESDYSRLSRLIPKQETDSSRLNRLIPKASTTNQTTRLQRL